MEKRGPKLGRSSHRRRGRLEWGGGELARRADRIVFCGFLCFSFVSDLGAQEALLWLAMLVCGRRPGY